MSRAAVRVKPKHDLTHEQMARELRRVSRIAGRSGFVPLSVALNQIADELIAFDRQCKANAKQRVHSMPLGQPREE